MSSIAILTLFPQEMRHVLDSSILRRAQLKGLLNLETTDLRQYAQDKHRSVDDTPYGGQQGMLFKAPVLENAFQDQLSRVGGDRGKLKVIYPHPRGLQIRQPICQNLADWLNQDTDHRMVVLCGRYEGIDERAVDRWVDLELSLGDFILSGAEIPALALVDSVTRLVPGVLGDARSARQDSFSGHLLEHPQYTKPREFEGLDVPQELLGGNHRAADDWKIKESLMLTAAFRPDLIRQHRGEGLPFWALELLERLKRRLDLRT